MTECATCVVIMCGLPASGKTDLVGKIQSRFAEIQNYQVLHVCYDEIMTTNYLPDAHNHLLEWKSSRHDILSALHQYLSSTVAAHDIAAEEAKVPAFIQSFVAQIVQSQTSGVPKKRVVVIDDNMYYRSMRYQYYQLAKDVSAGFCQVYIDCPLSVLLRRNSCRPPETMVTTEVIERMDGRLEPPDPGIYHWERNTLVLGESYCEDNMTKIEEMINHCLHNPVLETRLREETRECSRQQVSASLIHQADQILRKLVSQTLKTAAKTETKSDLKTLTDKTSLCKRQILEEIRSGCLCMPKDVASSVTDASKHTDSLMYQYVSKLYHTKIS